MTLKERLKNSPYINNWRYPVVYFAASAVFGAFFIWRAMMESPNITLFVNITIPLFTILIYPIRIAGDLLSVNFVIKNHRQTPLLFAVILGILSFMLFIVRSFFWHNLGLAVIYPCIALFVTALIYHFVRFRHNEAESIMSYGIIFITLGLMLYCLVSFLLGNYGGISLVPLLFGTLVGGGIFALGLVLRKKSHLSSANLSVEDIRPLLEEHIELFIAKLFKGLSLTNELVTLREQITASLKEYLEINEREGISANKLFVHAVDSLGDYSAILLPYRKNIFARFAGSNNKAANLMFSTILQIGLMLSYVFYLSYTDWSSGSIEWLEEDWALFFFISLACIAILLILRVIENFRLGRHLTTPLSLGGAVILPLIIVFIIECKETYSIFGLLPLHIYIVSGVACAAIIAEIALSLKLLKNKKENSNRI